MPPHIAIIGAGPAGLTAAYLLAKENIPVTVLEADPTYVGGIARTVQYKDFCFDIGGHRFFSKSAEVEALWSELLPHDMLERPRSSRIYYRQQFFSYPLKALEALRQLGILESFYCVISYFKARLFPIKQPQSFEDWVTNHFGKRLFNIFFKTYTEKVWGMRCEEISADWAAQRIKGLSLMSAIRNAVFTRMPSKESSQIKTLIDHFRYPRKGPGMLWEACAEKIKQFGGRVLLNNPVTACHYHATKKSWQISYGDGKELYATHVISTAPLRDLVLNFLPTQVSVGAAYAANQLQYRDFLIVVLILKEKNIFTDNWIYIHEPHVEVARIQNFKSWSPDMVPHADQCCYGMEYFCFKEDALWASSDEDLIAKAVSELVQLGLGKKEDILDGCVVRQAKAYPVYDNAYEKNVALIRKELETRFPSLYLAGRNGMHKYNNQDHAMMTAMLTVKNILNNHRTYDVWQVNQDAEYLEAGPSQTGLRVVPRRLD